jgi:hypothetical protein
MYIVNRKDGIEGAFDFAHEINDNVGTGQWVGDCFIFTNNNNRLNYFVGGEVITMAHLHHTMYMLGYLPKEDRVFLVDNGNKCHITYSYDLYIYIVKTHHEIF